MKKTLVLPLIFLFLVMPCAVALDVNYSDTGFGFQNGEYIYFRDPIVFDDVTQVPSTNATYGNWLFFQKEGASEVYGFYSSGVNVTVNTYFVNDVLELACVGSGTVQVQVFNRDQPDSATGAVGVFDVTNGIVLLTVTSSGTVQVSWNSDTPDTPSSGGDTSSVVTPTPPPSSGAVSFQVSNIEISSLTANSTFTSNLQFTFSGSSHSILTVVFSEPFNLWYQPEPFTLTYLTDSSGLGAGELPLTFRTSTLDNNFYSGTFTVTAQDAFGVVHTSSGEITATTENQFGLLDFFRNNPLYLAIIAGAIIVALFLVALFTKRR